MSYSIRIERGENGAPMLHSAAGELPGAVVITGHEDQAITTITAARVDSGNHPILSVTAQRPPEPGPLE